ncbi:MAG: hypothetical protein JWP87_6488, partial [Labilithrix sp.]|nr:hypothetical protein [Labilithrix sp.]
MDDAEGGSATARARVRRTVELAATRTVELTASARREARPAAPTDDASAPRAVRTQR